MNRIQRFHSITLLVVTGILFSACSREALPPLVASDVVVNEALPGQKMAAAYLSLTNNTDAAIRLTRVSSPDYAAIEMHETVLHDGVARMREIEDLVIAPGSTVTFSHGGMHLMLMQPRGEETVSLDFYQDETLLLSIRSPVSARDL